MRNPIGEQPYFFVTRASRKRSDGNANVRGESIGACPVPSLATFVVPLQNSLWLPFNNKKMMME